MKTFVKLKHREPAELDVPGQDGNNNGCEIWSDHPEHFSSTIPLSICRAEAHPSDFEGGHPILKDDLLELNAQGDRNFLEPQSVRIKRNKSAFFQSSRPLDVCNLIQSERLVNRSAYCKNGEKRGFFNCGVRKCINNFKCGCGAKASRPDASHYDIGMGNPKQSCGTAIGSALYLYVI